MSSSIYVAMPLMIVLAIIQTAVLPLFPSMALMPQVPLLVILSRGLLRGVNDGVLWAFVAGISLDLFSASPLGLTSLALMAAILIVIWIGRVLPPNRLLLPTLLCGLATIIWQLLYLLLLRLFG
jgi:rod shape-determining protein MreD